MNVLPRIKAFARNHPLACGSLLGGLLSAGLLGLTTNHADAGSKYMSVEEVKPGMKGYGLTVFSGTKPERFDVEIISTLKNFRPGQDLFLVRTDHPRLDVARTVAGMSGSPIYIDGKMIGAYAYGWLFNVEPIAGVTPIQNMLDDLRRPVPKVLAPGVAGMPLPGRRGTRRASAKTARAAGVHSAHPQTPTNDPLRFNGSPLDYDLRHHARQVAAHAKPALQPPVGSGLRPATTDVIVGGLGPEAMQLASEWLEPTGLRLVQGAAGGKSSAGNKGKAKTSSSSPKRFVDGGVIHVQMARGDVALHGLGTVTHVVGNKLIAFGHPMFNGGIENLPTALGRVHWVLSTQNRSFKIGEPIEPLGALVNDRQASIVVDMDRVAPTIPVELRVKGAPGAPKTRWSFEVAHDQFLAPSFMAVALGNALKTTAAERNDLTWRATSTVKVAGQDPVQIRDFGAGAGRPLGVSDMARSRLVRAVGSVLNNPWRMGRVDSVKIDVNIVHRRETAALRGAQLLTPRVDPGGTARIRLTFEPYHGQRYNQVVEVPVDRTLAGRSVAIRLTPGYRARPLLPAPHNFDQLVRSIPAQHYPGETLVASYSLPHESSATFEGHVAKRLPPGAVDALQATTETLAPRVFSSEHKTIIPTRGYILGQQSVTVQVRNVLR